MNESSLRRTAEHRTLRGDIEKHPRLASAAAILALGGAAMAFNLPGKAVDYFDGPDFSPETTTVTVDYGDTLTDVASQIDGAEQISSQDALHYIGNLSENADLPQSSELQPGTEIEIPVSVEKP